jgi:hypothetical protein
MFSILTTITLKGIVNNRSAFKNNSEIHSVGLTCIAVKIIGAGGA